MAAHITAPGRFTISATASGVHFEVAQISGSPARLGRLQTAHGVIDTPAFMPVATQATVKGLTGHDLREIGVQALIANTYHLTLRPGAERIADLGGIHRFMGWDGIVATDSGGFQVFSLGSAIRDGVGKIANIFPDEEQGAASRSGQVQAAARSAPLCAVDETGVTFRSHLDGAILRLTPRGSMELQHQLGSDLMMAFDECTSPLDSHDYTSVALERTHRWALECLDQHAETAHPHQALYGIVQGGMFRDLREASAEYIGSLPFGGFAVGGSLGRSKSDMHQILDWTLPLLPEMKPRHLLGIGELDDILHAVARGIDTFDCAAPTRWARNGALLISEPNLSGGSNARRISIGNARYAGDPAPLDPACDCFTCRSYSRAYLHHLHRARELVYYRLASLHNLRFMMRFMAELRAALGAGEYGAFLERYGMQP